MRLHVSRTTGRDVSFQDQKVKVKGHEISQILEPQTLFITANHAVVLITA